MGCSAKFYTNIICIQESLLVSVTHNLLTGGQMVVGENQGSWCLFSALDSVQEIMQKWQGLAT